MLSKESLKTSFNIFAIIFVLIAIFILFYYLGISYTKTFQNKTSFTSNTISRSDPSIDNPDSLLQPLIPSLDFVENHKFENKESEFDKYAQELKEYDSYSLELNKLVEKENPKSALQKLQTDLKSVKIVQENCHSFTHEIGNYALKKYKDIQTAISYNLDTCGGGYLHGLIEDFLLNNSTTLDNLYNICSSPKDGGCFHALGHGFMLKNKFQTALSVNDCNMLKNSEQKKWCGEGVFMENFDSLNVPDKEKPDLKSDKPFYPCDNYTEPYQDDCYYYSGRYVYRLNSENPKVILECQKAPKNMINTCTRGMSAAILREDLSYPAKIESICDLTTSKRSCLLGAINYHLFMFGDKNLTIVAMCYNFNNAANKKTCTELVQGSTILSND